MWCLKNVFERKKKDKGDKGGGGDGGGSSGGQANARRQDSGESGSSGDGGAGGAGSRVSHEAEEIEEQQRVNKLIEKQIKKDKRRFRSTHRLQVVGLEGSGKSTLIHQLRLLDVAGKTEYFTDDLRRERRAQIRALVRDSAQALAQGMRAEGIAPADEEGEAEERRRSLDWLADHATRDCPEPCQALYEHARRLWADAATQAFFRRHRHNQELASAAYFLDRVSLVSRSEYLPTDEDILRHYQPTTSLQETSIEIEHVTFCLFEVNSNTNNRLVQQASDAIALIFVADIAAFDAVIDRDQGLTRLHEALLMFRSVWNTDCPGGTVGSGGGAPGGGPGGRHGISRSVILFLNKVDLFEEKVRKGGVEKLRRYFPRLEDYQPSCQAAKKELEAKGANPEVVRAKYFVRDSFLQVAAQGAAAAQAAAAAAAAAASSGSAGGHGGSGHGGHGVSAAIGGPGGPGGPLCYPHFTCAIHTEDIGKLINDCCRDILQRVHLRMHEIL